jgi:general secretion pathway protein H
LVEILVVMVIIGVVAAGAMLSLGVLGQGDRELERERDRLEALIGVARDEAALQGREYGLRIFIGGYEFVTYDPRRALWSPATEDGSLRRREFPEGLELALRVEGRPVVLPKSDAKDATPQIMLFSSGELNGFEFTVARVGSADGFRVAPARSGDAVSVTSLAAPEPR